MIARSGPAAGLLLAALVLVGCATGPATAPQGLSGRLLVRVDASAARPASALTAGFELLGDGEAGELRLSSGIGTRLAQARWSALGAWLDTGQGEVGYADLDDLSRTALGEPVPLRALPDWLSGRPWPRAPSERTGAGFVQLGWSVQLTALADGRVEAVREAAPRVVVRVQLERAVR